MPHDVLSEALGAARDLLTETGVRFEDMALQITERLAAAALASDLVMLMQGFDRQRQELEAVAALVAQCAEAAAEPALTSDPDRFIDAAASAIHMGDLRDRFLDRMRVTLVPALAEDEAEQVF